MTTTWKQRSTLPPGMAASRPDEVPLPWFTVEVAVYGAIFLVGLGVRLAALGRWPLLETGANTALAAWRTVQGSSWRPDYYIPLLYAANLVLFYLTRATDAAVTLLPALAGAGLVLVPYFVRGLLGRKAMLVAALLLAFAPTWVFYARTADGPILTAAASALLLLAAYRYAQGQNPRDVRLGVIALGVGLTAGPGIYTTLLAILVWGAVAWWRWRGEQRWGKIAALLRSATARDSLLWLVGVFVFLGSGFLVNPAGIGASVGLLGHWAGSLSPTSTGLPWWAFGQTLFTYEFLTLVFALVGVVWAVRQRDPLDMALSIWAVLALVLGTLLGHRDPTWLLDALLPLVLLAARTIARLWDELLPGATRNEGLVLLLAIPVVAFGYLELASYMHTGQEGFLVYARIVGVLLILTGIAYRVWGDTSKTARAIGAVVAVGLIVLEAAALNTQDRLLLGDLRFFSTLLSVAGIAYWVFGGRDAAARVGAALLVLLLAAGTVRATTAVAYQAGRDPRESLVLYPASAQLSDFEALVATLSSRLAGDPHALSIDYEQALDPWVAWYLRDYPRARRVASLDPRSEAQALVTRPRLREEWPAGYAGQTFRLRETWRGEKLPLRDQLRWALWRAPVGIVQATEIQLWVRPARATGK